MDVIEHSYISIELQNETLQLLPEKAIFWPAQSTLLLADLHLGKVAHFRKSGIALPPQAEDKNWQTISRLMHRLKPKKVIILGDLFHSDYNDQWENFILMTDRFAQAEWILVKGNHDTLRQSHYNRSNLSINDYALPMGPFLLTHEPDEVVEDLYTLCGHIHPGLRLVGPARQSMRVPCFSFSERVGILPAFGVFTGLHILQPELTDQLYVVAENKVVEVPSKLFV